MGALAGQSLRDAIAIGVPFLLWQCSTGHDLLSSHKSRVRYEIDLDDAPSDVRYGDISGIQVPDGTVGQDLDGFTAEHNSGNAVSAVRGHDD